MPHLLLRSFLLITLTLSLGPFAGAWVAQEAANSDASAAQADKPQLRLPRQPGEDIVEPLEGAVDSPDEEASAAQAAYMAGLAAQKRGEFSEALKKFQESAKADPDAADPVRAQALLLLRLGRVRQAETMARKAVELDPDDYQIRLQLAAMVSTQGKVPEALTLIEEALQSKRLSEKSLELVRIHALRGRLCLAINKPGKAGESYEVLLDALEKPEDFGLDFREHQALMKDRETGYQVIGAVMLELGRNDNAIRAYQALARVNEGTPGDYHLQLAIAQFRKDDVEDSEENLQRYFETNRRAPRSLQLLRDLYEATSREDEIPDRLRMLAENTNDADRVNMFLGDYFVDRGRGDDAVEVYQSVIANSATADAYLGLIRVDILNRDHESLLKSVVKALKARIQREELVPLSQQITNEPEFAETAVKYAVEQLTSGNIDGFPAATHFYSQIAGALELFEEEAALLEETLSQNPDTRLAIETMSRVGINLFLQENYQGASQAYRRLLGIPGLPQNERLMTLYRLSMAEAADDNFDQAVTAIQAALDLRPQNALLSYQLGLIQLQAKRFDEAERTLKATIKFAGSNQEQELDTRLLLGALYSQMARWDEAITTYKDLLAVPSLPASAARRVQMSLSNAYVQGGDMVKGEQILEQVYEQSPDDPGVNNDLGYLYAEQNKNLEQAEVMVRIAVEAEPENPAYLDSLGWVLYRLQKYEEALEALKRATADPSYRDSTILEHLGDVQKALKQDEAAEKSWKEAVEVESDSASPNSELVDRIREKLSAADTEDSPTEDSSAEDSAADGGSPEAQGQPAEEVSALTE